MAFVEILSVEDFLSQFFGNGNKFHLAKIEATEDEQSKIRPWVELLTQAEPTVLPYWHNKIVDWYGIAFSERQLRRLNEELMAFVGSTYSTFRGQRVQFDLQNPIELAVYQLTKGTAVKFSGDAKEIWAALERMRRVKERQVVRIADTPVPTGRVLRDFYMALQAGNRISAENSLQYLSQQHRFDGLNLLFLRVQLLAELEQWQELLTLDDVSRLLQIRRPFAVTQALLKAIYCTEFQKFEENNAPSSAVSYFKEVIFPRYRNLFTIRYTSKNPDIIKLFMLLAVAGEPSKPGLRDEILAIPGIEEKHQNYLRSIAGLLPDISPPRDGNLLQQADELCKNGDFDQAFLFLSDAPHSKEKVRLLLECAYELQDSVVEKAALSAFDEMTVDEQNTFKKSRLNQDYLSYLLGSESTLDKNTPTAQTVPVNWLEWLSYLDKQPNWERAIYIARQGGIEWDVYSLLSHPQAIEDFCELLETVTSKSETIVHNALPHMLAFFQKDEQFPRRDFLTLYYLLLELLVYSTQGGDDDLVLFNELTNALLILGVETSKYIELVDNYLELWNKFAAPKRVDRILDLIDLLISYPCPVKEKREQILFAIAQSLRQFKDRIDETQWVIFRALVKDLQLEQSIPDLLTEQTQLEAKIESDDNIYYKLKDKSLLIYTLTETAAIRVKSILEARCREVSIYLSHDKGGNKQLGQWVKNSDIVVMVTASAKHAATGFIEANRPSHLAPILLVNSKGSASMLREIKKYLAQS